MVRTLISFVFFLTLSSSFAQYEPGTAFFLSEESGAMLREDAKVFHQGLVGTDTMAMKSEWTIDVGGIRYVVTAHFPQSPQPGTLHIRWTKSESDFGSFLHTWADIPDIGAVNTLILREAKNGVETVLMGDEAMAEIPSMIAFFKLAVARCTASRNG